MGRRRGYYGYLRNDREVNREILRSQGRPVPDKEGRGLWLVLAIVVALLIGMSIFAAVSKAGEPFVPGEQASIALAESVWHPPCDHVGVEPMTAATKAKVTIAFGVTPWDKPCYLELNWPLIKRYADNQLLSNIESVRKHDEKVFVCAVIVHEMGHVAGFYDPVGAPIWTSQGQPAIDPDTGQQARDHDHSPDPRSIMYPYSNGTYWRCRRLFAWPKHVQGRRPLPDSAPAQSARLQGEKIHV